MRKYKIDINDKPFISELPNGDGTGRSLRVTFHTQTHYTDALGLLDLRIYNLSKDSQIERTTREKPQILTLSAGYDNDFAPIFNGYIMAVLREKEGANIVTHVLCKSGFSTVRPTVSKSFGRNSTILQVLDGIREQVKLNLKIDTAQFDDCPVLSNGYVANGDLTEVLNKLGGQFDFQWAIDGSTIVIDRLNKPRSGVPREVSMLTGLIGYPEASQDNLGIFVECQMRLSPQIHLGTNIDLKSEFATFNTGNMYFVKPEHGGNLNGIYKVIELSHEGDSHGNTWRTKIKGMRSN